MKKENIIVINGDKYYTLPKNSYYSWHYEDKSLDGETTFNYSYTREPVEGDTTVYADHYVTHIHLRDDVKISTQPNDFVNASWDSNKPDPFVVLRPCTCGSGLPWQVCSGTPDHGTTYCG